MIDSIQVARYPISMVKYGLIPLEDRVSPNAEPYTRYRVIWSGSRFVRGFRNGQPADLPVYFDPLGEGRALSPAIGECWILEKWLSCREIAGTMQESEWNTNPMYMSLGAFPKHGWFDLVTPLSCNPGDADFDILIGMVEKRVSASENYQSIVKQQEQEKAERKRIRADRMDNAMRPWGADAYVALGGSQGTKTETCIKSAKELGLPQASGATATADQLPGLIPRDNQVFEVKISI